MTRHYRTSHWHALVFYAVEWRLVSTTKTNNRVTFVTQVLLNKVNRVTVSRQIDAILNARTFRFVLLRKTVIYGTF